MNLWLIIELRIIYCDFELHATVAKGHVTGRGGGEVGHFANPVSGVDLRYEQTMSQGWGGGTVRAARVLQVLYGAICLNTTTFVQPTVCCI